MNNTMSALENQPDNLNHLSPLGFRFTMDRIPKCTYFLQGAEIPNISLGDYVPPVPLLLESIVVGTAYFCSIVNFLSSKIA